MIKQPHLAQPFRLIHIHAHIIPAIDIQRVVLVEFIFKPYLKTITETNRRWIASLNSAIRDLEVSLTGHTGSQEQAGKYDWFDFNR